MTLASPNRGADASTTSATSPRRTGRPVPAGRTAPDRLCGVTAPLVGSIRIRWVDVSEKPPPRTVAAAWTALWTSDRGISRAIRASGRTRTSSRRNSPPKTVARATPAVASKRGRTVHCTRSRSAIGLSVSLTNPILSRSMVEEVNGLSLGADTPTGRRPAASLSASPRT